MPPGLEYLAGLGCAPVAASPCVAVGRTDRGKAVIVRSTDGGATWARVVGPSGSDSYFGASCADATHCWVVGQLDSLHNYDGTILASVDGGLTWTRQTIPVEASGPYPWIRSIACQLAATYSCWAVGPDATSVLATVDGGTTWTLQSLPPIAGGLGFDPEGVSFSDASDGVLVGGTGCGGRGITQCPGSIYRTTDGGTTWTIVDGSRPFLDDVSCVSATRCWAVASTFSTGVVLASADGGQSWRRESVPNFFGEMNRISCATGGGDTRCWAVGDDSPQSTGPVLLSGIRNASCWSAEALGTSAGPLYDVSTSASASATVGTSSAESAAARAWHTSSTVSSPVLTKVSPTGGRFDQPTTVTITGCGFSPQSTVSFGQVAASSVTYVSPTTLQATMPAVSVYEAGSRTVTVRTAGVTAQAGVPVQFASYVPEIGRLIFHDPGAVGTVNEYGECTGSVVDATNGSVVLTAGHCVGGGGGFNDSFSFAPGYYGPACSGVSLPSTAAYLSCGTAPYGVWSVRQIATNNQWLNNADHALDYAFLVMSTRSGKTIQQAIGGGLSITFNPGSGQDWTTFGEPGDSLLRCTGTASNFNGGSPGPQMMEFPAATCAVGGSSGGPWINGSNGSFYGIGAVNSESDGTSIVGATMGNQAQNTFQAAETSTAGTIR